MIPLTLTVNGTIYAINIEPNRTLVDVLRDVLGLTGTKKSCNEGECGACTVLMDGKPVASCLVLAVDAQNKKITTIEGLAVGENIHPLQESFVKNGGIQCGFCTPGMIMSAKALLDETLIPRRFRCERPYQATCAAARAISRLLTRSWLRRRL